MLRDQVSDESDFWTQAQDNFGELEFLDDADEVITL